MTLWCAVCMVDPIALKFAGKTPEPASPNPAVTVWNGNAICGEHFDNSVEGMQHKWGAWAASQEGK